VVLAIIIFLGALAAIGQVISAGTRAAIQGQLRTEAILRCESKLAEIVARIEPMVSVDNMAFEDGAPDWTWSLDVLQGPHPDVLDVEVTVMHTAQSGMPDVTFSLRRYVRDPQMYLDATFDQSMGF
jgi:general secretion pathway protein I